MMTADLGQRQTGWKEGIHLEGHSKTEAVL